MDSGRLPGGAAVTAFEVVIRLGRPFSVRLDGRDRFVTADEFVTVPFANREAAEGALRDVQMSVRPVHDVGGEDYRVVLPGDVVESGETVIIIPDMRDVRDVRDLRELGGNAGS
jgi:hypothetical protein